MPLSDILPFFFAWLRDPRRIAAVAPSGASVAALMTRDIGPDTSPVLELGPGTGSFTHSILARGVGQADLTLVEFSADFVELLSRRFPEARIVRMDAALMGKADLFQEASVGAVVSGLGFRTMPLPQVASILRGAFRYLRADGAFYQITYGPRCPVPDALMSCLGLQAALIGRTLRNLPPASVYRITRSHAPA
ncbi:class I SAM-dependent methyltransferase [Rhizobiaceae sp. 2RAB30]